MAPITQQSDMIRGIFKELRGVCFENLQALSIDKLIINPFLTFIVATIPRELAGSLVGQR